MTPLNNYSLYLTWFLSPNYKLPPLPSNYLSFKRWQDKYELRDGLPTLRKTFRDALLFSTDQGTPQTNNLWAPFFCLGCSTFYDYEALVKFCNGEGWGKIKDGNNIQISNTSYFIYQGYQMLLAPIIRCLNLNRI